ncbi:DUF6318 family protein [Cellulomonas sp. FA1]|uniref:DUF6318 family protein n=1 Tax=Cellulomonas sp. FA1 TaxID=1346710 RepID=UPI0006263DD5|nr:DUF6318 family protein [Cellulomonas sp. FA1]
MAASALLGALVLVAGCTPGGGQGAATPTPSTTPTATTSPTAAPTPTPMRFPTPDPAIAEPTPEGAIAAGTQFLALYDYAYSTGDAAPLLEMSAEGCVFCTSTRDEVRAMVEDGYASLREPASVVWSDSAEIREDEWFRVHLRVEQGPLFTIASDGSRHQTSDGGTVDLIFAMSWLGDRWRVEQADVVQPEG